LERKVRVIVAGEANEPAEVTLGGREGVEIFSWRTGVGGERVVDAVVVKFHGASREQRRRVE
jgi:hypothetical protein